MKGRIEFVQPYLKQCEEDDELRHVHWERLWKKLMVYAGRKMRRSQQRRGELIHGLGEDDIVQETIVAVLEGTRTRNKERYPELFPYLCSVIDSKVHGQTKRQNNLWSAQQTIQMQSDIAQTLTPEQTAHHKQQLAQLKQFLEHLKEENGATSLEVRILDHWLQVGERTPPSELQKDLDVSLELIRAAISRMRYRLGQYTDSTNKESYP